MGTNQQQVTSITVPETVGAYRSEVNTRLVSINANFNEIYTWGDHRSKGYITEYIETDPLFTAWDKDYNDLINRPVVPTAVSQLTNDSGFISSYTETDPLFTAWDKDYADLTNTPTALDIGTMFTGGGEYLKADGTTGTPEGVTYTAGTGINITGSVISSTVTDTFSAWDKDYADLINTPTGTDISALFSGTGDYLKADGSTGTPDGVTYTAGTGISITGSVISSTVVNTDTFATWDKDYADLINTPTIPPGIPVGAIIPFIGGYFTNGSNAGFTSVLGNTVTAINTLVNGDGWYVCDGSACNIPGSTIFNGSGRYLPNLTDNRFIMGATSSGSTGGSNSSSHTHSIGAHTHTVDSHFHTLVHTHGVGSHTHSMGHSHTVNSHYHSTNATTLSASQMPSHNHSSTNSKQFLTSPATEANTALGQYYGIQYSGNSSTTTYAGSGLSHTHGNTGSTSTSTGGSSSANTGGASGTTDGASTTSTSTISGSTGSSTAYTSGTPSITENRPTFLSTFYLMKVA